MQDMSPTLRGPDVWTQFGLRHLGLLLEWLLNLFIPILHPFYLTRNTILLQVVPHLPQTTCYLIYACNVHACP